MSQDLKQGKEELAGGRASGKERRAVTKATLDAKWSRPTADDGRVAGVLRRRDRRRSDVDDRPRCHDDLWMRAADAVR
ncbi:Hypothetical predicted protein [Marmota monax]|uniref:Uncharacterized protein n=1 Tax=Marmota monax TaxID=9995 RepID=A0A5E4B8R6_MARMO|nr:Hypothetical predicted protein [Marmota monax]